MSKSCMVCMFTSFRLLCKQAELAQEPENTCVYVKLTSGHTVLLCASVPRFARLRPHPVPLPKLCNVGAFSGL